MKAALKRIKHETGVYYFVNGVKAFGKPDWLTGNISCLTGNISSGLYGNISCLTGNISSGLYGNISCLIGNISSGLYGNISSLTGNISGLTGNIDDCEISDNERENGISVESLIESSEVSK